MFILCSWKDSIVLMSSITMYTFIERFTTNNIITRKKLGLFLIKVLNAEMQLWIIKPIQMC